MNRPMLVLGALLALNPLVASCQKTESESSAPAEPSAVAAAKSAQVGTGQEAEPAATAVASAESPPSTEASAVPATTTEAPVPPPEKSAAKAAPEKKAKAATAKAPKVSAPAKPAAPEPAAKTPAPPKATPAQPKAAKVYSGDKPCHATKFRFGAVRSACQRGGLRAAKSLMKSIVKKAKAKGTRMKCSTCHSNQKTYPNKPNAVKDLRPWM